MAQSSARGAPQPKRGVPYRDYAAAEKSGGLRLFASPRAAALVLAAAVVFGTLYGGHRSLSAARPDVHGTQIEQLLERRGGEAYNLTAVAARYPGIDPDLIDKTREVAATLTASQDPEQLRDANRALTDLTGRLMEELGAQPLTEQDANYLAGFRAQLLELTNRIEHDPYHLQAQRFNDILQNEFPANILAPLTGVQPAAVF